MLTIVVTLTVVLAAIPALGSRLPYIIGGEAVTDASKYPWQGSLQYYNSHTCGCALISNTWAVTAAHCVGSLVTYSVRFGSTLWGSGGQKETVTTITRVYTDNRMQPSIFSDHSLSYMYLLKHEDYNIGSGTFPNDVAVIKFSAVTLGDNVTPIAMATEDQPGNSDCHITGWGHTSSGGGVVSTLREAHIEVYTDSHCRFKWPNRINDGHVCIGDSTNGRGSCTGDSGGPLVCKVGSTYQLVGVTSWGKADCGTNYPSVYTRIPYFVDWINKNTSE